MIGPGLPSSVVKTSSFPYIFDESRALQTNYTPEQLTMDWVHSQRHGDFPVGPSTPQLICYETLDGSDLSRFKINNVGAAGGSYGDAASGGITVTSGSGGTAIYQFLTGNRPRSLCVLNEVTVAAAAAATMGMQVGIFRLDNAASIFAYFNGTQVGFGTNGSGPTVTTPTAAFTINPNLDFTLGVIISEPDIICYVRQGDQTKYLISGSFTLDGTNTGRDGTSLQQWRLGFALSPPASNSITAVKYVASYMPGLNFQNPRLVTYRDGTPYTRDGMYYLTGTPIPGSSADSLCGGVWEFDPVTHRTRFITLVLANDTTFGIGHPACDKLIYDEINDQWIMLSATWGFQDEASGTNIIYGTTTRDPLRGGVLYMDTQLLNIGTYNTNSYYDIDAYWDGTNWQVACIETDAKTNWTNRYPCLFTGPTLTSLTRIRNENTHGTFDGAMWIKVGGVWYFSASGTNSPARWNNTLTASSYVDLSVPWTSQYPYGIIPAGSYMSHYTLIPVCDGTGVTRYLCVAFGGDENVSGWTPSIGSFHVLEARQAPVGWEFPRRRVLVAR